MMRPSSERAKTLVEQLLQDGRGTAETVIHGGTYSKSQNYALRGRRSWICAAMHL